MSGLLSSAYDELMRDDVRRGQLARALDRGIAAAHASRGNIQIFDAPSASLRIVAQRGFDREFLDYFDVVTVSDGSACARALVEEQVYIPDVDLDDEYAPHRAIADRAGYRAVLSATITGGTGITGMLSFHFAAPRPPTPSDRELVSRYVRLLAPLLESRDTDDVASAVGRAYLAAVRLADQEGAAARLAGESFAAELTPELELEVRRFVRQRRRGGARIEVVLLDVKRALIEAPVPLRAVTARDVYDAAIALAIRVYFDECEC